MGPKWGWGQEMGQTSSLVYVSCLRQTEAEREGKVFLVTGPGEAQGKAGKAEAKQVD